VSGRRGAAISARVATTWSSPRTPCVAPPPPRPRARRYTAFIIELRTHGGLQWVVERRFSQVRWRARAAATAAVCALPATPPRLARRARALTLIPQFYKLNQILKQRYDELRLFKFPQKRWFSSFATQTVEQRRRVFEVYLLELLSLQPRPVELNTFLDINQHIWGGARDDGAGGGGGAGGARAGAGGGGGAGADGVSAEGLERLARGEVSADDFELLKVLGKGSFGKVFLVRLLVTGQIYAMKVLKKSEVVRRRQVEHTKAERRIMGSIEHPFIVSLRFAFASADKLYMITDYCKGGELFFHLKKFRTFPEAMVRFFAAELISALSHLHSLDIVYRCARARASACAARAWRQRQPPARHPLRLPPPPPSQRPQARERAAGRRRPHPHHRLWPVQGRRLRPARRDDLLRHARVPRARNARQPQEPRGLRQGRGLVVARCVPLHWGSSLCPAPRARAHARAQLAPSLPLLLQARSCTRC
jgi:hypothetical protein